MKDGGSLSFLLLIVLIVMSIFILAQVALYRIVIRWNTHRNDKVADATMVTKRSKYMGGDQTLYYATFETKGKARKEYEISEQQYGLLAAGDQGKLTLEKDKFIGFTLV